jgi:hypothetical protein
MALSRFMIFAGSIALNLFRRFTLNSVELHQGRKMVIFDAHTVAKPMPTIF